ncbi:MAG: Gfo/Idh/MocA family oxidoreductase, partial [Rhodobacteraceae bacterium]|nr:Gfo/Idh/MocA family oxidoreductase [Paracoccaceae bacterium]
MRWGLIGASSIAEGHVIGALRAAGQDIVWVHSGTQARAGDFARRNGIPGAGTDLDALLADAATDAVYISSTNEKHHAQAMQAIAAGKHVLCEK